MSDAPTGRGLIVLAVLLSGCASQQPQRIDPQVAAYDAAVIEYQKNFKPGPPAPTPVLTPDQQQALEKQRAADIADQQAREDCRYQAQMTNITSPGLVTGFFTAVAVGSACLEHYRNLGVIR